MGFARRQFLFASLLAIAVAQGWAASASAQVALPPAAKERAPDDDVLTPYLRFDRITGMTKGGVNSIAQDDAGFIWFGTEEGLSRYDGYGFVNYVPGRDPANTLSNFTVTALATDKDSLWIGTVKGLNRLHLATDKFTHLTTNANDGNTIASDYIASLHLGRTGLLWIGTADAGVDSLNPVGGQIRHYRHDDKKTDSLSDDAVSVVLEDQDGKVWIGTPQSGLDRLDPQSGKVTRYANDPERQATLSNDEVTSIYQDKAGTVWVGTMNGLNRFDPKTNTFTSYLVGPEADPKWITTIIEGADGGLWLGVKGVGVFRLDRTSGSVEKYTTSATDATSIASHWTRAAFSDRGGVLWFGFSSGDVSKLYLMRREFTFYRTNPGLSFLEQGNQVWLGSQGRGLRSLDLKTGVTKSYLDEQLSATWTMNIVPGDNESLWLGTTDRGLFHFTPSTGKIESYDTASGTLGSDAVFALLRQGETLWIGTFGAGLGRFETGKKTIEYFTSEAANASTLSSDHVVALHQDRSRPNVLWVGTSAGLNELDKRTGKVVRYLHDPAKPTSLSHDHITDIHEDRAGRLWISTWGGGLNLLDRKTGAFTAYHTGQGLASEVLYGILEDKSGALWITTNDGLTRFDPNKDTTINYREGDGLQADEFAQGGFHQGDSGRFYVGGPRGFNVFAPEQVKLDTYLPPMVVTKFEILGETRSIPKAVSLSFRDRWFSMEFSALAYASPARNQYKYRLTGFHDWIETDRRFVSFSSLPSGDYTLEILGSNAHGVWNEDGVRLPIHVAPPPWFTWWAYTSYGLIAVVIVGLLVRRQRRQLDQLEREGRLALVEHDLALTGAVQSGFLPEYNEITTEGVQVNGFYRPADACSGDWWWHEPLSNQRHVILVGDVTGHGPGPAMVTAAVATAFRVLIGAGLDDVKQGLELLNREVLRVARGKYHMTMAALELDEATGRWILYSAGAPPMLSLNQSGKHKVHFCAGSPLGTESGFEIGIVEGALQPADRLLIYTDGIPEIAMINGNALGMRRFAQLYERTRGQDLKDAAAAIVLHADQMQAGQPQLDDWTFTLIEWKGGAMSSSAAVAS